MAAILPYGSPQWEKLEIFLRLLVPKLPSPQGGDYTEGLLEDVDLESYRAEAQQTMQILLDNENGEITPVPVGADTGIDVPEMDTLTHILQEFHDVFGNIEWTDEDRVKKQIADLPSIVRQDEKYQNAMKLSDEQNARAESDRATNDAILATMSSGIELYKAINQNDSLRRWILNMVFNETYQPRKTSPKSNRKVVTHTGVPEDRTLMVAEDTPVYGKE